MVSVRDAKLQQIDRLISSDLLHGSESLCRLLRYLARHSLDHAGEGIKEHQIATEVFHRPPDFDPRLDATVRVQTGRLRAKLAEYYARAGADDPWLVEIPKGSHTLVFRPRSETAPPEPVVESTPLPPVASRGWPLVVAALALAVCATAVVAVLLARPRNSAYAPLKPDSPLAAFWKPFTDSPDDPWVVFSNAEFVGTGDAGMHYFNPAVDDARQIQDYYTGVGEVLAVHDLDRLFVQLRHGLRVKRGRLLSLDDAKSNDLIFVGSPSENLALREIPTTHDFVFRRVQRQPGRTDLSIVNVRPRPGEPAAWLASPGLPLTEDYAVVGLMPGLNPSRWVLVLAGISTLGTQAAVEYVCRPATASALLKRSGSAPFEAVLRVKVTQGVPVQSELAAFRPRH
jgi:hypothetical protein